MNHVQAAEQKAKEIHAVDEDGGEALRQRVEHVRDIVESVRDKAEVAFRDKPYLVPVTAGVVGFGIGVLVSSKLTRFLLCAAVGSLVSEAVGGEIKRIAGEFIGELHDRLDEGDAAVEPHASS